ncbi:MAG: hypothetical protein CMP47_10515 [Rickettsiales bacterium]|nr:hypothetical protein [Rickettsiales bacterium]
MREEGEVDEEEEEDRGGSAEPHRAFIFFLRGSSGPKWFWSALVHARAYSPRGVLEGPSACCSKLELLEWTDLNHWIRGVQCLY